MMNLLLHQFIDIAHNSTPVILDARVLDAIFLFHSKSILCLQVLF